MFYYRKNSAASQLKPSDINEDYIAQAKYLHITGITPALSTKAKETIFHCISLARKNNVRVVFDPNIRLRLWSKKEASIVLNEIAKESDIILPGLEEGTILTGEDCPKEIAKLLLKGKAKCVVVKCGGDGVYYKTLDEEGFVLGEVVTNIVDPIGAGDGFSAGLLSCFIQGLSVKKSVIIAHKVAALALTVPGDAEGYPYLSELETKNEEQVYR